MKLEDDGGAEEGQVGTELLSCIALQNVEAFPEGLQVVIADSGARADNRAK